MKSQIFYKTHAWKTEVKVGDRFGISLISPAYLGSIPHDSPTRAQVSPVAQTGSAPLT